MTEVKEVNRLDTNEEIFFRRQLEKIKAQPRDVKYKELKFSKFIPISTDTPSGSESITWRQFSEVGVAKFISNYADDFPRVDVYGEEFTRKIKDIGASFGYNTKEIKRAALAPGSNLNSKRANATNSAIMRKHNQACWIGDTDYNIPGFINYPGISEYVVPNGTGGFKTFASKTPDEILTDLFAMRTTVLDTTNGVEEINQILMPIAQYNDISQRRVTDGNDKTVLQYFLENSPGMSVDWLVELKGVGAGGTDQMVGYVRDNMHLEYDAPTLIEQMAPERDGLEYKVIVTGETAGVVIYYPQAVIKADGI